MPLVVWCATNKSLLAGHVKHLTVMGTSGPMGLNGWVGGGTPTDVAQLPERLRFVAEIVP